MTEHPDFIKFKEAFRGSILNAMDEICSLHDCPNVQDRDLPVLFQALDGFALALWMRSKGFKA